MVFVILDPKAPPYADFHVAIELDEQHRDMGGHDPLARHGPDAASLRGVDGMHDSEQFFQTHCSRWTGAHD